MTELVDRDITRSTVLANPGASRFAVAFLRLSLGVGLLSAVADRLGFWGPPGTAMVSWGNFHNFLSYTARLNPWCPAVYIPVLGVLVTIAEGGLGCLLIFGLLTRISGLLSGILALTFAAAMTLVFGVHAPLNYEVFVFSAASFLLASQPPDSLSIDWLRAKTPGRKLTEDRLPI